MPLTDEDKLLIWGAKGGSTSARVGRGHGRIKLTITNDFDSAVGIFDPTGARELAARLVKFADQEEGRRQ